MYIVVVFLHSVSALHAITIIIIRGLHIISLSVSLNNIIIIIWLGARGGLIITAWAPIPSRLFQLIRFL